MSPIKNVIFIMLDTLQFNYLGCYGNTNVKTPNLDRFARQGFLFENVYSEGLPTIPVRRAIMTGRFTLPYAGWKPLDLNDTSLTDMLWCREVQTALVYDTPPMRLPKYGYSRGFDFVSFNPGQELDHTSFADVPLDPALKPEDYTSPTMVFNEKGEVIDDDSTQLLDEIGCFLRQQQFRNDLASEKLDIAKGEWALKQSKAAQSARQASTNASAKAESGLSGSGLTAGKSGVSSGTLVPYSAARLRSQGRSDSAIRNELLKEGYTSEEIKSIMKQMNS